MKILVFDTSSKICSVALLKENEIFSNSIIAPKMHANLLLDFIADILKKASLNLQSIDAIAFGAGPGAFTGVRISTAVAQAFYSALNIPLIKVSTLEALSYKALSQNHFNIVSLIDARQNELYFCKHQFDSDKKLTHTSDELVLPPNAILGLISREDVLIGDDFLNYTEFHHLANIKITFTVSAEDMLLSVVKDKFLKKDFIDILDAQPNYIRNKIVN